MKASPKIVVFCRCDNVLVAFCSRSSSVFKNIGYAPAPLPPRPVKAFSGPTAINIAAVISALPVRIKAGAGADDDASSVWTWETEESVDQSPEAIAASVHAAPVRDIPDRRS